MVKKHKLNSFTIPWPHTIKPTSIPVNEDQIQKVSLSYLLLFKPMLNVADAPIDELSFVQAHIFNSLIYASQSFMLLTIPTRNFLEAISQQELVEYSVLDTLWCTNVDWEIFRKVNDMLVLSLQHILIL
jgi:hypothetical protein